MQIQIVSRKRMSTNTVSFTHIYSSKILRTIQILSLCNWFQMCRIYANDIFTKMVKHESVRHISDKGQIKSFVSQSCLMTGNIILPIASGEFGSCPFPARVTVVKMFGRDLNLREQTSQQDSVDGDRISVSHCKNLLNRFELWLGSGKDVLLFLSHFYGSTLCHRCVI